MPNDAVVRLQDPVVLVWEVEELRWYASALECCEGCDAFAVHETVVFGPVDD